MIEERIPSQTLGGADPSEIVVNMAGSEDAL